MGLYRENSLFGLSHGSGLLRRSCAPHYASDSPQTMGVARSVARRGVFRSKIGRIIAAPGVKIKSDARCETKNKWHIAGAAVVPELK